MGVVGWGILADLQFDRILGRTLRPMFGSVLLLVVFAGAIPLFDGVKLLLLMEALVLFGCTEYEVFVGALTLLGCEKLLIVSEKPLLLPVDLLGIIAVAGTNPGLTGSGNDVYLDGCK